MTMELVETNRIKSVIESLLLVSAESVSMEDIKNTIGEDGRISVSEISQALSELADDYQKLGRGFRLVEIAGKFQLCTDPENGEWVRKYLQIKNAEALSKPALETLAIVAYRQPITKLEIEGIRGVNVDGMLKKLTDKGLVRTRGKKEVLGHPFLYVTTEKFLEYFGLRGLEDLPQKEELLKPGSKAQEVEHEPRETSKENRRD